MLTQNSDKAIVQRQQLNQSPEFFLGRALCKLQVSIIASLSLSSAFAYAKSKSRLQALTGGVAREETDLTRMHSFYKILLASLETSDKHASLDFTLKLCCT